MAIMTTPSSPAGRTWHIHTLWLACLLIVVCYYELQSPSLDETGNGEVYTSDDIPRHSANLGHSVSRHLLEQRDQHDLDRTTSALNWIKERSSAIGEHLRSIGANVAPGKKKEKKPSSARPKSVSRKPSKSEHKKSEPKKSEPKKIDIQDEDERKEDVEEAELPKYEEDGPLRSIDGTLQGEGNDDDDAVTMSIHEGDDEAKLDDRQKHLQHLEEWRSRFPSLQPQHGMRMPSGTLRIPNTVSLLQKSAKPVIEWDQFPFQKHHAKPKQAALFASWPEHENVTVQLDSAPYCSDVKGQQLQFPEVRKIIYVKTHKTGSSTVGNMLYRFATLRRLRVYNPLEHYMNLGEPTTKNGDVDITLYHNMKPRSFRQLRDWYQNLIPGGVFVTIVREPVARYISHWNYFDYTKDPESKLLNAAERGHYKNFMCTDLGIKSTNELTRFLETDWNLFPVVLILDRMDESLVIMKRLFHWRLDEDIYHMKVLDSCRDGQKRWDNKELACPPKPDELDDKTRSAILEINECDKRLYEAANRKLDDLIARQDDGFYLELAQFREAQDLLSAFCTKNREHPRCGAYLMGDLRYEECIKLDSGYPSSMKACSARNKNNN